MITGTLAILVFALFYWKVLPERFRPSALLLFGLWLYRMFMTSVAVDLGLVVLILLMLQRAPNRWLFRAAITMAIVLLAANKYAGVPAFKVVGLSYVSFRVISLCRDLAKRQKSAPTLLEGLIYALFPPTFLSGPIEPYEQFQKATPPAALSRSDLFLSLSRIAIGLIKKLLLVEPLRGFADQSFGLTAPSSTLWLGLFAFSLFVYLDFSAYSDLAIGSALLFGYPIGENFNWPYLSANISEFWTRWHISVSRFLRDHVFVPLSGQLLKMDSLAASPGLVAGLASLFTMLLCGMWHGDRLSFAAWGLGHGGLIVLHQFHRQSLIGSVPARRRKQIQSNAAYKTTSILLTFFCVTLLWVPFRFSLTESALVYERLFSPFFHMTM